MTTLPQPREDIPPLMNAMRVAMDHWALTCMTCTEVFIVTTDEIGGKAGHFMECGLLSDAPLSPVVERIRDWSESDGLKQRALELRRPGCGSGNSGRAWASPLLSTPMLPRRPAYCQTTEVKSFTSPSPARQLAFALLLRAHMPHMSFER